MHKLYKDPTTWPKENHLRSHKSWCQWKKWTSQGFLLPTLVIDVHHFSISKDQERKKWDVDIDNGHDDDYDDEE